MKNVTQRRNIGKNIEDLRMDEREIVCSKCERTAIAIRDSVQSGWIIEEPGWALVNYSHLCPRCRARYERNNDVRNERNREYPMEGV